MNSYIVSYLRTPFGRFGKSLAPFSPSDLGAAVIKELVKKKSLNPSQIDMVIMGNVLKSGHGQDLTRQAIIKAGLPDTIDGYVVDMVCSSSMMSVINGAQMTALGDADLVIAGGMESMSNAAFCINSSIRQGVKFLMKNNLNIVDTMYYDGLTDPMNNMVMGAEADRVAKEQNITKGQLDEIALLSHTRAAKATDDGVFSKCMVPIKLQDGTTLSTDEGIRKNITAEKIASLAPVFGKEGLHTAASSSQITDGASAMILTNEKGMKEYGLEPEARILGYSWAATESWRFTQAPSFAIDRLIKKLKVKKEDIDYVENNEAFAVSSILMERYGFKREFTNIYGGAIAIGHPIGASGSRIIGTLITALKTKNGKIGIASLCHGTGGATAVAIELL